MRNDPDNAQDNEQRLEAAWRSALEREEPPAGFAERVEARLAAERRSLKRRGRLVFMDSAREQLATAAGLVLAIVLLLGLRLHHQAEIARGEAAKQQVLFALRITGTQLRTIQERTQGIHAGSMPEGEPQ